MSEQNGDGEGLSLKIPDGLTTFELPNGGSFGLDIIDVCKAIDRISNECEGKTNYEYLDLFIDYIRKQTQGAVMLSPSQADWLIDHIRLERSRQKKTVADALRSLTYTASTPSDSANASA